MTNSTASPHVKYKWLNYIWPSVAILLTNFLKWKFDWSLLTYILFLISLVIVVPYLLYTGPKKISFLKYVGIMSAFFGLMLAVVVGAPTLLTPYIPFGYGMGLMWIVFWQGLYWYGYWKEPKILNLRTFTIFLLLCFLPAAYMTWSQYRTQSLLKKFTEGKIPVSIQNTEVTQ